MDPTTAGGLPRQDPTRDREVRREHLWRARRVLVGIRRLLGRRVLHLLVLLVAAFLVLKLIPGLEGALEALEGISGWGIVLLVVLETCSESGYAYTWQAVLDPEGLLRRGDRGRHLGARVAWAQLGGGMVVPGGSLGSVGVGAWMLRRLGMPMEQVLRRQLTLIVLNTAVDALAVVFFGLGLAIGLFGGEHDLALTLLPAAVVAALLAIVLAITRPSRSLPSFVARRARIAKAIEAMRAAVADTARMLSHRGSSRIVLGAIAYLLFDMLVLQGSFTALGAQDRPNLAVVAMCYLIGALGGSIPLPANLGAVGGISAMLIVFGVDKNDAISAVVVYQAIGLLVPLVGGGLAYLFLRRRLGRRDTAPAS